MKPFVVVTGGAGYIGATTALEMLREGKFTPILLDNFSNATPKAYTRIKELHDGYFAHHELDVADGNALMSALGLYENIAAVIHFAAFKSVPESVAQPARYYRNNLDSLISVVEACQLLRIPHLVFSSSCSVYGEVSTLPVNEATPILRQLSPYGHTKWLGEQLLDKVTEVVPVKALALRYFNPVGADASGKLGEDPSVSPNNLVPVICQAAAGLRQSLTVFGHDYPTRDGTCVRDYVHVTDIALAHLRALDYMMLSRHTQRYEVMNLGTGEGVTVLEAIRAFENVTGVKVNYALGPRREGDVPAVFSDSSLAHEKLNWRATRTVTDMMQSAWLWQKHLATELY